MFPYIGITDFTDFKQVDAMNAILVASQPQGSNYILHAGVMMSHKTLHNIPTKWSKVWPKKSQIRQIFALPGPVLNCLHLANYDGNEDLAGDIGMAIIYGGDNLHAIQLDMYWPDPDQIIAGMESTDKKLELILQVGRRAMDEFGEDVDAFLEKLANYAGIVHRVLLDKSQGQGLGLDAQALLPYAIAVRDNFPWLGIGVAGGLGPSTMDLLGDLPLEIPNLSIDAQSKLRPSGNATDPIDWSMAAHYIMEAMRVLS